MFVSKHTLPVPVQLLEYIVVLVKLILYAIKIHSKINVKQIYTAERKHNELLKVLMFGFKLSINVLNLLLILLIL